MFVTGVLYGVLLSVYRHFGSLKDLEMEDLNGNHGSEQLKRNSTSHLIFGVRITQSTNL